MDKCKIVCRALIVDSQQRILFVKKSGSDFWSLPGGKLETFDSTMQECMKRELQEELGAEFIIKDLYFVQELHKNDTRYVEFIWQAEPKSDVSEENIFETSDGELMDIQWIKQGDMTDANAKPDFLKQAVLPTDSTQIYFYSASQSK